MIKYVVAFVRTVSDIWGDWLAGRRSRATEAMESAGMKEEALHKAKMSGLNLRVEIERLKVGEVKERARRLAL